MKKKMCIFSFSAILFIIVGVIVYQSLMRTTFEENLKNKIGSVEDITHITIQTRDSKSNEFLWAKIEDPIIIKNAIDDMRGISLQRQFRRGTRELEVMMTVHTFSDSYYYNYDDEHFVNDGKDHKILSGSFIEVIDSLDLEFVDSDEFMGMD
ncbi:hypothetical protein ACI2JA_17265 [Alkalihalobacillus sp. NPDC078783]